MQKCAREVGDAKSVFDIDKKALIHVKAIAQKFSHVYLKNTDLPFMFAVVSITNVTLYI